MVQPEQIEEFVREVNKSAKHQQDLIQSDLGVSRTLAPGTHAGGSHLTKTLISPTHYSIDEKMGQTYVHEEQANTLAARDYKQPQAVTAYGLEPGAAQRMNSESRISEEVSPTLRAKMGDNQASVISTNG